MAELQLSMPDAIIETDFSVIESINCDPVRIGQLVSNLLGNAFSHGDLSQPVRFNAWTDNDGWDSVSNAGAAIPAEVQDRLFHPGAKFGTKGKVWALHIASEIGKAHGGTLTVQSTDAETRFTFLMPTSPMSNDG
ncbi:sensor histidine kinase [Phyllobacterium chamaecytisi]|uniref:sensor histidine kinase n=1 Tax=Phyllobacterium chamaecytisi TaxID=2876082 RepID=UPI001CC9EDB3|nr:ATP-binding protein [Phyllobacterium sp. KW56]MBZ9603434.1 ATP-binding protein [Phyllobacterium sp. KW56]